MKFHITALGGTGRSVRKIAGSIVDYLIPGVNQLPGAEVPAPPPGGVRVPDQASGAAGMVRYYADSGLNEEKGRWSGRAAGALGLHGEVGAEDFAAVLAGRDPRSGLRLISAQGSAGRRPRLGVGAATRRGPGGEALYDARDAAAVLELPQDEVARMIDRGTRRAVARLFGLPVPGESEGSYLAPLIDAHGRRWVTGTELARCQDDLDAARAAAAAAEARAVAESGPAEELLSLAEAARIVGVTPRYLRGVAKNYETRRAEIDAALAQGRSVRRAYLVAQRGPKGRWLVTRGELAAYLERRRPPAVRVGFDVTLTTEKSLGIVALLGDEPTRRAVLDAARAGNDWAMAWLERHAAAARANDEVVPVKGWMVASFQHLTSRALDPFPHWHNVVPNTVEDHQGVRRALDARGLYRNAQAASALATAEMRSTLTRERGLRWRPAGHGGWEIAGIDDALVREYSRRTSEIADALRELEEAIGRGATAEEIDRIKTITRPDKTKVPLDDLLADWRRRAEALGFGPAQLAACTPGPVHPPEVDAEALYTALATPDGICAHLSIFDRGDLLAALVNQPLPDPDGADPQPPIVPAWRLEELADGFLASRHVAPLGAGRYTTRDMLALQDRIVARYRQGRHRGAARVAPAGVDAALARHPLRLIPEQQDLVRSFATSGHRVQCAIGQPGTGKTTAMAAARAAWEAAGWRVLGAAVKGEAARTLGAATGMPTETLAWYLAHEDPLVCPLDARTVLIVDEASTISDRDLDRLGWLAEQTGASLRLIGDPAQHGAVEAGGMFRVLCERHPHDTPQLTETHRLQDPHDRAAAEHLRTGDVDAALAELGAAGHLHIVTDDLDAYTEPLADWWQAHQAGLHHPMVSQRNDDRRALNRLAHQLRRAAGEIGTDELTAVEDRRYSVGDRVIARIPNRHLYPPGRPAAYVRNGAVGTITALTKGRNPAQDRIIVDFDGLGTITLPRGFFDEHPTDNRGHRLVGIDHAYAVTSFSVTGATHAVSTSRIDQTATRAETYVDITRGQQANHLYLVRHRDDIDHERLPRIRPQPIDHTISDRLAASRGERTAWEIREDRRPHSPHRPDPALTL